MGHLLASNDALNMLRYNDKFEIGLYELTSVASRAALLTIGGMNASLLKWMIAYVIFTYFVFLYDI